MNILIAASGNISNPSYFHGAVSRADFIICADGGAVHLDRMNVLPDLVVGDLDSISRETRKHLQQNNVPFEKHPPEKDFSDTELATEIALSKKPSQITYIGVTGSRLDHTVANIALLKKSLDSRVPAKIIDEHNEIHLTDQRLELTGKKGDLLSIIPMTGTAYGVTLRGLKYPLTNRDIPFGASIGVSNVFAGNRAVITLTQGLLMVTKSRD